MSASFPVLISGICDLKSGISGFRWIVFKYDLKLEILFFREIFFSTVFDSLLSIFIFSENLSKGVLVCRFIILISNIAGQVL
jgi:hypothetical protein